MKKPRASLVLTATLPFVFGCFGVAVQPIPDPVDRADTDVVGVVMQEASGGERVEFSRVDAVDWAQETLTLTGVIGNNPDFVETRSFELPDLSAILVKDMAGTQASIIVGGLFLVGAVITAFVVTGKTEDGSVLGPNR